MSAFDSNRLNCYILRKSTSSFHVDITHCKSVSELKEKILHQHKNALPGVEVYQLKIWKHCMSTLDLRNRLANLQPRDDDALDGAVLLSSKFSDACLGQIHVIAEVSDAWEGPSKKRKVGNHDQENDEDTEDETFASLQQLWDCAWDNPASEAALFETRDVIRDGTLPDTVTPNKYRVLTIPGNVLREYSVKSILIRPEYIIALAFAIFVAKGGKPPGVFAEKAADDEEDDDLCRTSQNEWDSTMQHNNPFSSLGTQTTAQCAVAYLGHPGTGKTLFLFFVLALRVLQSLPSIYMVKPDCIYIVDSKRVRKIPTKKFRRNLVTDAHWCLVDSNRDLKTVPTELLTLGSFIMQTTSPRAERVDWWKKSSNPCTFFFMKEWSLSELIVGRTLQARDIISEQDLKSFLDRFLPSAREAFKFASIPNVYDAHITRELGIVTREKIQSIVHSARSLNFDDQVSHIVLVTPQTDRINHRVELPTRYLYDKLIKLANFHAFDAAFLLYEAFKGVKESMAPVGFIYEDLIGCQLPPGGRWPVVSMKKSPKKRRYIHLWTTGNEEGDTYLRLGQGTPFEFVTSALPSDTFGELKKIFYIHDGEVVLETGFYIPLVKNEATFDGFTYDAEKRIATVFQATVGTKHSVKTAGLEWLKGLGVEKVHYVGVTPVGQSLDLPFDPILLDFVEQVYQLAVEPICAKDQTL